MYAPQPHAHAGGLVLEEVERVIELLAEEGHTRMPIYEGNLDHIKGVLHTKDVIPLLANPELIVLHDLLRPSLWVPWTKRVDPILAEMQQKRIPRVLVADDDASIRSLLVELLTDEGYEPIEAATATEMLALYHSPQRPALVLLDVQMPELDGLAAAIIQQHDGLLVARSRQGTRVAAQVHAEHLQSARESELHTLTAQLLGEAPPVAAAFDPGRFALLPAGEPA